MLTWKENWGKKCALPLRLLIKQKREHDDGCYGGMALPVTEGVRRTRRLGTRSTNLPRRNVSIQLKKAHHEDVFAGVGKLLKNLVVLWWSRQSLENSTVVASTQLLTQNPGQAVLAEGMSAICRHSRRKFPVNHRLKGGFADFLGGNSIQSNESTSTGSVRW